MKRSFMRNLLSVILIAAMITVLFTGCGKKEITGNAGTKNFTFEVVDREGKSTEFKLSSDKATVGEALLDEGLIEGNESEYGLYVTKVNGIEAIYEKDGTYWSFYINGEYAMTGVDTTELTDGATYSMKVEGN